VTEEEIDDLLFLIYFEPVQYLHPSSRIVLPLLLQQHPGLERVFRDLHARNVQGGSFSAGDCMKILIDDLSAVMNHTRDPAYWRISKHDYDAPPEEMIVRAWAIGSVKADLGHEYFKDLNDERLFDEFADMRRMIYGDNNQPDYSTDTDYWRGMAILRPIYVEIEYEFDTRQKRDAAHRFIEWSGKHPNPGVVAETAIARRTLDVDTLESVISQAAAVPVLGDGVL
jgi:hypothetical protein